MAACCGKTSRTETSLITRSRLVAGEASVTLHLEGRIKVDSYRFGVCSFANPM